MKYFLIVLLSIAGINASAQSGNTDHIQLDLKNETDSLSYFLGLVMGYDLKTAPFQADAMLISEGLNQALEGSAQYDQEASQTIFRQLQMAISQEEAKKAEAAALVNVEKGAAFLDENGKREGVNTTESGLQYEVLNQGDGAMPTDTSKVTVHYEGTLVDGTVFDSSYERGEPISFPLSGVIPGWTEGVQLMPVGSTYKFYIPSNLGYGPRGQGPIPANSVLIFKIELLGIE